MAVQKAVVENCQRQMNYLWPPKSYDTCWGKIGISKRWEGRLESEMLLRSKGFGQFLCIAGNQQGHAHGQGWRLLRENFRGPKLLPVAGIQAHVGRKTRSRQNCKQLDQALKNTQSPEAKTGKKFIFFTRYLEISVTICNNAFSIPKSSLKSH